MIGICTRYRKQDSTLAAIALMRQLEQAGRRFKVFGYDWRATSIDPAWDNCVKQATYRKWLDGLSHVVWTAPVDGYFLEWAHRKNLRTSLYTSWEQFEPMDERIVGLFTHILVPSLMQAIQVRDKFRIKNVAVLPYDPGMPITKKTRNVRDDRIRLFMSIYGTQLRRIDLDSIFLLADIVKDMPNIEVTIGCSKGLGLHTRRDLKHLEKVYPDRWCVLWNAPWYMHVYQFGLHDLTIWPTLIDGMGVIGTTSLCMGTPVISWDVPPINEYMAAGRNSLLVPTNVEYNWMGIPHVKPDYPEFNRVLRWILGKPDALAQLREHTATEAIERHAEFKKGWEAILPATF